MSVPDVDAAGRWAADFSWYWQRDILDLEQEHNDADKQVTDLRSEIEAMTNEKSAVFDELQKRKK